MSESERDVDSKKKGSKKQSNLLVAKLYRRAKANPVGAFIIDLIVIVASALVLSLVIKTFLIRSFYIPSGSMEKTLQINDRIIVNELVPNIVPLERGDVVVFKDPGGWLFTQPSEPSSNGLVAFGEWISSVVGLSAPDSAQHLVKRVIGIGGDHVVCTGPTSKIQINGVEINEPYLQPGLSPCAAYDKSHSVFDITVPKGSIWVMGDNRNNSEDSRFHTELPSHGFVPLTAVVGRAFVLSWPLNHFKWLDNYANEFKQIPNN